MKSHDNYSNQFNAFFLECLQREIDFNELYFNQDYKEAQRLKNAFILDYFNHLNFTIDYADIFILINKQISIQCFYRSINLILKNGNYYLLLEIEKDNFLNFCSKEYSNNLFEIEEKDDAFFISLKIDKINFLKLDFYEM